MKFPSVNLKNWPKLSRIVFIVSSLIFLFTLLIFLDRFLTNLILQSVVAGIETGPQHLLQIPPFIRYTSNLWVRVILEYLVILVIVQAIRLTLREGRNWRTVSLAAFYGLLALLLALMFTGVAAAPVAGQLVAQASISTPVPPSNHTTSLLSDLSPADGGLLAYISALTGLITAITGFYAQTITARRLKAELELQRIQLQAAQQAATPRQKGKPRKKKSA